MELAKQNSNPESKAEQLSNAKKYFERATKVYSVRLNIGMEGVTSDEKHMHLEYCHSRLMNLYREEKNFDEALYYSVKALESARIVYLQKPERVARCLENIAACYSSMENYVVVLILKFF